MYMYVYTCTYVRTMYVENCVKYCRASNSESFEKIAVESTNCLTSIDIKNV